MASAKGGKIGTVDKGITSAYYWNRTLTFYMPRVVIVQIWQLGLLNLLMQVAVVLYFITILANPRGWALFEVPVNRITNAYVSGGAAARSWAQTSTSLANSYPYCGTSHTYDFVYNGEFNYSNVRCEPLNAFEVGTKLPGTASVASVYLDIYEEGWDCTASDAATKANACTGSGGELSTLFGTQCMCTTRETTYPVGVDAMFMNFDHEVQTSSNFGSLDGSSNGLTDDLSSTEVRFTNGTKITFAAGQEISLSIADWLAAGGVQLDGLNAVADTGDASHSPFYRTTGVTITLAIEYSNIPKGDSQPSLFGFEKELHATVTPKALHNWAGLAVKAPIYEALPTGPEGAKTYRKLLRYSQGVVFKFSGVGLVWKIDQSGVMTFITNFLVLFGLTSTITTYVAKWAWPTREMIKNKAQEKFAVGTRLVEISMKALEHAVVYNAMENAGDKDKITMADLTGIFKKVKAPLTDDEAKTIAAMIIARANDDQTTDADALRELDFIEYFNNCESSMLNFDEFKKLAVEFADKRGYRSKLRQIGGTTKTTLSKVEPAVYPEPATE